MFGPIKKTLQGLALFLLFSNVGLTQGLDIPKLHDAPLEQISADQMVLMMVSSAYLARVYEHYLPWWQADLLAFSSTALYDLGDHLLYGKKGGFQNLNRNHTLNLEHEAIGVLLNRALPIVFASTTHLVKQSIRESLSLRVDPQNYPKLLLSLKLQ